MFLALAVVGGQIYYSSDCRHFSVRGDGDAYEHVIRSRRGQPTAMEWKVKHIVLQSQRHFTKYRPIKGNIGSSAGAGIVEKKASLSSLQMK